jgi:DNA-binding FadR family transcriptional regulator
MAETSISSLVQHGSSQTARVAEALIDRIETGAYEIGARLPSERQLATEFEVSRPVVREALRILRMLQVIDVQVGRGAFVTGKPDLGTVLDPNAQRDLLDVVDVREVIETGALRLARERATDADRAAVAGALAALQEAVAAGGETAELDRRLHETIIQASKSQTLRHIWNELEDQIRRSIRVSPHGRSMSPEILRRHETLAAGITDGAVDAAVAAASELQRENRAFLAELIRETDESSG